MDNKNGATPVEIAPKKNQVSEIKDTSSNILKPTFRLENIVEQVKSETINMAKLSEEANEKKGLLIVKSANKWIEQAKKRPVPQMLFGEFWFEGEICILFADTNMGKSILAVQIGNSISRGEQIKGFRLETTAQPILYFDFELSDKQFEKRYSLEFADHYEFSEGFKRVEIDPSAEIPGALSFEEYLMDSIEKAIIETGSKVLIIDNLTYLRNEIEKSKDALPLMKKLKDLTNKYLLSLMVLAHTPKRDLSKPITKNDLSGSKMLINFCDSSFSIGESHTDKNIRYLKQIKARSTEHIYDSENVCNCQIYKPRNFLQFEFVGFGAERDHLRQPTVKERENQTESVIDLKQSGLSFREIGAKLGISHMTAKRVWEKSSCNTP